MKTLRKAGFGRLVLQFDENSCKYVFEVHGMSLRLDYDKPCKT